MKNAKFRPVLTSQQITHLISLCKKDLSNESLSCLSILLPFEHKISNSLITPAYTTQIKSSKIDELGFSTPTTKTDLDVGSLHTKYLECGEDISQFSLTEIKAIQLYRYENDLMTPEQEKEYEAMVLPQLNKLFSE